jgi:hypothetical protein
MQQPVLFNVQFLRPAIDGVMLAAADCQLSTHPAGTPGTDLTTYTDQAGLVPNTNPIILDADGRCALWLDPAEEYLLRLFAPVAEGGAHIRDFDDVAAAATATGTVTSVNGEVGDVVLSPGDIDYTGPVLTWLTAANVQDALDQLATRVNAPPAQSVTLEDTDGFYTGDTVEEALAELGATSLIPDQTGNEGEFLTTDGDSLAWAAVVAGTLGASGEITIGGRLWVKWGNSATIPTDTSATVTFTTAFPTTCFGVLLNPTSDLGAGGGDPDTRYVYNACLKTAAGFKINNDSLTNAFFWIAFGN